MLVAKRLNCNELYGYREMVFVNCLMAIYLSLDFHVVNKSFSYSVVLSVWVLCTMLPQSQAQYLNL
jgi:hypothetical protein